MADKPGALPPFERIQFFPRVDRPLPEKHWKKIRLTIEPHLARPERLTAVRDAIAQAVADYGSQIEEGITGKLAPKAETHQHLQRFRRDALRLIGTLRAMSPEASQRLSYEIDFPHEEPRLPDDLRTPAAELSEAFWSLRLYLTELVDVASFAASRLELERPAGRPAKDFAADHVGLSCRDIWRNETAEEVKVLNRGGPSAWERFLAAVLDAAGAEGSVRAVTERLVRYADSD